MDFVVGTFSKSLAGIGGVCVSDHPELRALHFLARAYVFTASGSPANVASVRAAVRVIREHPELRDQLWANIANLRTGLQKMGYVIGETESPIVPIFTGDETRTIALWQELLAEGLYVNLIVPPGCPRDECVLRASCSAAHTPQQIAKALDILERARVGVGVTAYEHPAPGPPVDPETRFEVVSIKPSDPSAVPQMSMSPGRYNVAGVRVQGIITDALRVPSIRIIGLPDWSSKERYTIAAKAPEGTPSTDGRAMFVMLTNLLKDRFRMAMHTETREMPVYNLVFARNDKRFGPAFKESSAECRAAFAARVEEGRPGAGAAGRIGPSECESVRINPGGTASLSGVRMDMIAQILMPYVGRPVIDKTGLTSYYNVTLKWTPEWEAQVWHRPACRLARYHWIPTRRTSSLRCRSNWG